MDVEQTFVGFLLESLLAFLVGFIKTGLWIIGILFVWCLLKAVVQSAFGSAAAPPNPDSRSQSGSGTGRGGQPDPAVPPADGVDDSESLLEDWLGDNAIVMMPDDTDDEDAASAGSGSSGNSRRIGQ